MPSGTGSVSRFDTKSVRSWPHITCPASLHPNPDPTLQLPLPLGSVLHSQGHLGPSQPWIHPPQGDSIPVPILPPLPPSQHSPRSLCHPALTRQPHSLAPLRMGAVLLFICIPISHHRQCPAHGERPPSVNLLREPTLCCQAPSVSTGC